MRTRSSVASPLSRELSRACAAANTAPPRTAFQAHVEGSLEAAAEPHAAGIAIDASYVPALFNLGIVYSEKGNSGAAIESYRTVIDPEETYAPAHLNLGGLFQSGSDAEVHQSGLRT